LARSKSITWRAYGLAFSVGFLLLPALAVYLTHLIDTLVIQHLDYRDQVAWRHQRSTYVPGPSLGQALFPDAGVPQYDLFSLLPGDASGVGDEFYAGHGMTAAIIGGLVGIAIHARHKVVAWSIAALALAWMAVEHSLYNWHIASSTELVPVPQLIDRVYGLVGSGYEVWFLVLLVLVIALIQDYQRIGRTGMVLGEFPFGARVVRYTFQLWERLPDTRFTQHMKPSVVRILRSILFLVHELLYLFRALCQRQLFSAVQTIRVRHTFELGGNRTMSAPIALTLTILCAAASLDALNFGAYGGSHEGLFLADYFDRLGGWWNDLPLWQQSLLVIGTAAISGWLFGSIGLGVSLASVTSGAAAHGQGTATFLRNPRTAVRDWWKNLTPAEAALLIGTEVVGRWVPADLGSLAGKKFYKYPAADLHRASPEMQKKFAPYTPEQIDDYFHQRQESLIPDPDHNFKQSTSSPIEARVATELEWRGDLKDLQRPDGPGKGDFVDNEGNHWEMKSFQDKFAKARSILEKPKKS
jgi:hypothetical protein